MGCGHTNRIWLVDIGWCEPCKQAITFSYLGVPPLRTRWRHRRRVWTSPTPACQDYCVWRSPRAGTSGEKVSGLQTWAELPLSQGLYHPNYVSILVMKWCGKSAIRSFFFQCKKTYGRQSTSQIFYKLWKGCLREHFTNTECLWTRTFVAKKIERKCAQNASQYVPLSVLTWIVYWEMFVQCRWKVKIGSQQNCWVILPPAPDLELITVPRPPSMDSSFSHCAVPLSPSLKYRVPPTIKKLEINGAKKCHWALARGQGYDPSSPFLPTSSEGWGKVMFSVCPYLAGGGVPRPGQARGVSQPGPDGGYPSQGVHKVGYTSPAVMGYPPQPGPQGGVPPPPVQDNRWGTWYAAVGMPLEFTQDFFVFHFYAVFGKSRSK